jgi:hypothetical protein
MSASQMILLLYAHAMSLSTQILVEISLGTVLIHVIAYLTSLANLGGYIKEPTTHGPHLLNRAILVIKQSQLT